MGSKVGQSIGEALEKFCNSLWHKVVGCAHLGDSFGHILAKQCKCPTLYALNLLKIPLKNKSGGSELPRCDVSKI